MITAPTPVSGQDTKPVSVINYGNATPTPWPGYVRDTRPAPVKGSEAVARAICKALGTDPNMVDAIGGSPVWYDYTRAAEAAIEAMADIARQAAPAPASEQFCPACQGSGEGMMTKGSGPDSYEVPCTCPYCKGSGGLLDAYHGLVSLFDAEREKYMQLCGKVAFSDMPQRAPASEQQALFDDLESAIAGWGGGLVDKIEAIIQKYRTTVDCGACPGDGSICKTECRLRSESLTPASEQQATTACDCCKDIRAAEAIHGDGPEATTASASEIIDMLLDVVRLAHDAMDNTEDDGNGLHWNRPDFDALSDAMDKLDALPDDQPGYVMGPAAKARWAMRATAPSHKAAVPLDWGKFSRSGACVAYGTARIIVATAITAEWADQIVAALADKGAQS